MLGYTYKQTQADTDTHAHTLHMQYSLLDGRGRKSSPKSSSIYILFCQYIFFSLIRRLHCLIYDLENIFVIYMRWVNLCKPVILVDLREAIPR